LAELDRAKTAFFSNVSHEFRTPLTLMLGPLDDLRADTAPPDVREQATVIHRNALRLLRLVNTLLDFSRIEAGRERPTHEGRDSLVGIAAHELPRVFDRFHRVEGARGRTHEGTGIGLALVQELVRLHNGQIGVESSAGVGSTFTVRVPTGVNHLPADRVTHEA